MKIVGWLLLFTLMIQSGIAQTNPDQRLEEILNREWAGLLERQPLIALYLGEPSANLWPNQSIQSRKADSEHYKSVIRSLDELEKQGLSDSQSLNLRLFREQLNWLVAKHEHHLDLFVMNQREGLHTTATLADTIAFDKLSDYERWVERLETFGSYADQEIAALAEGIEKDRVQPRIIAQRMAEVVALQPSLHKIPIKSPFFEPFLQGEQKFGSDERFTRLKARADQAIRSQVAPAFERLQAFLEGPYLKAAPKEIGLSRLRGGDEAYRFLVQRYTTTDLSPEQIHQLGRSEVARIRGEMETIQREVGFDGTLEQFFQHLRTDPKHYTKDPQELLRRYRSFCKVVDGKMPSLFKTLPRKPYGVMPIPDYIAPATTTAYYMPGAGPLSGTYCVNLYQPETRAFFEIPSLSLHEAVPGHHHQIALAEELPNLPNFRKRSDGFGDYTVFVEGWALYAESLGEEMGLYDDPYDRFGKLTYEMWRAIRLVLDTGIHQKNWTREQAIAFFLSNSPRSELDVTNEVDRYISWPGQALAYKMGELKIQELRRQAERELGERFHLPDFHDVILKEGAVPLSQLERQVREYIRATKI